MTNQTVPESEYRIEFSTQRREDGDPDFTEIGFGSSSSWRALDSCTHDVSSAVSNDEWQTEPGMPDPDQVVPGYQAGDGAMDDRAVR